MLRNVVHLVPQLAQINFGIWNAAIFASGYLREYRQISSHLWVISEPDKKSTFSPDVNVVYFRGGSTADGEFTKHINRCDLDVKDTVFVSHGCWQKPSRLGYRAKQKGFTWICAPHGMLEPWSMQHKRWKKFFYFSLIERRMLSFAHGIRAVSENEQRNLKDLFQREVFLVENGVAVEPYAPKSDDEKVFLFISRLHHKKGILPFVQAWVEVMKGHLKNKLIIAGPDEGELEKLQPYLGNTSIEYVGPVYGDEKKSLMRRSHYFVLPSYSEGFPTSVVEAMSYGLIPLISSGCNFPAVFTERLGHQVEPDTSSLSNVLNELKNGSFDEPLSRRNHAYVERHNSETYIGEQLMEMYTKLLQHQPV